MRAGRAPDGLVGQLVEVDVEVEQRPVPPLLAIDAVRHELRQRHLEHPGDLARIGRQRRSSGQEPDERRDHEARRDRRDPLEAGHDLDIVGIEADLLARLSQRRGPEVGVEHGIVLAAGERDLALVRGHRVRALGQDHRDVAVRFEQRHQHRGRHAPGRPGRGRRAPGGSDGQAGPDLVEGEAPAVADRRGPTARAGPAGATAAGGCAAVRRAVACAHGIGAARLPTSTAQHGSERSGLEFRDALGVRRRRAARTRRHRAGRPPAYLARVRRPRGRASRRP